MLLVRHANASWKGNTLRDTERPLTAEGEEGAKHMAKILAGKTEPPDLIIASPATRALATAVILAEGLGYPRHEILVEGKIYHGSTDDLFQMVVAFPNKYDVVMISGHNPTITQLANSFLRNKVEYLPNNAIVSLQFDTDAWEEIPLAATLTQFVLHPGKPD